jgi:hypothetical protein
MALILSLEMRKATQTRAADGRPNRGRVPESQGKAGDLKRVK